MESDKLEAIGVVPGRHGFVRIARGPGEPDAHAVACEVLTVGCCTTDVLVMSGRYGEAPPGCDDLVTGHEVVVRALDVEGDLVTDIAPGALYALKVREPDPDAPPWAQASPDLAEGGYRERGILRLDGGLRPRLLCDSRSMVPLPAAIDPAHAVFVEPASCICKAIRIATGCRDAIASGDDAIVPRRALVLGAGSCGLLATAGFRKAGCDVVTIDRLAPDAARATLATALGAAYRQNDPDDPDLPRRLVTEGGQFRFLFDTTANPLEIERFDRCLGPTGVAIEFGIPHDPCRGELDLADPLYRRVFGTRVRIGSVSAAPVDWPRAIDLVEHLARTAPGFFARSTRLVDGLDIDAMVDAFHDPEVVKPVVCPNGVGRLGRD